MKTRIIFTLLLCLWASMGGAFSQIQAGRAVQIAIQGVPPEERARIDGMYPVAGNGFINMPFIGQIRAAGMQPENLAQAIQARYKSAGIYRNPTIQVFYNTTGSNVEDQVVHVGGDVRRTGPVKFVQGLTLYQAIQAAGGATEFGSLNRVKLFRGAKQQQFDLTQAQFMRVPLEPEDTIEVPRKNWLGR